MLRLCNIINVKYTQPKCTYGVNMNRKNMKNSPAKRSRLMTALKVAMMALSLWFSCAMTTLSGAGLIYNRSSYGEILAKTGVFLVISSIMMTAGAFLCLFRKKMTDILSIILSAPGLFLCLTMLHRLATHANKAGWTDKYSLLPVSDMYIRRILPCIAPVVMATAIAAVQLCSYESSEQQHSGKAAKQAKVSDTAHK